MLADNLANQLNPLKAKALSLVDRATKKASSVDDYVVNSIGNSVSSRIDIWLTHHPFIAWLVNHPVITLLASLIALILTIRLLLTIYRAIAVAIDRMWLGILRSPWFLLKFLFGWQAKPKNLVENTTITNYEVTNNSPQLQEIITRLDQIQQQQQEIIQELAMLKRKPLSIEPQKLRLIDSQPSTTISNQ